MEGTLYFVHGTGVRLDGFKRTMELIRAGMSRAKLPEIRVEGNCWGHEFGVALDENEISTVLPKAITKSPGWEPSDEEVEATFWDMLLDDPLFELRFVGGGDSESSARPLPQQAHPVHEMLEDMRTRLLDPQPDDAAAADLISTAKHLIGKDVPEQLAHAADQLIESDALNEATRALVDEDQPVLIPAIARSLVAEVLSAQRLAPIGMAATAAYRGEDRDRLVAHYQKRSA